MNGYRLQLVRDRRREGAVAVEQDGDRLTLVLRMSGEGETRDATYRFGLSNDGRWLTDLDHDLVRERCP